MKKFTFLMIIAISQFAFSKVIPPANWCRDKFSRYCIFPHPMDAFQAYSDGFWCYAIGNWKSYEKEIENQTKLWATHDAEKFCQETFKDWDKTVRFSARRVSPWKFRRTGFCSAIYSADFDCQNKIQRDD